MTTTITDTKPQFALVDANTVEIENNVRTEADLDPAFLATVKQFGILTPVRGRMDADGKLWVRMGQMRTLAARATGQLLPIMYYEAGEADAEPAWFRAAQQLIENDHRTGLTVAHHVAAWKQMELDGLSVTKIAGILGEPKERVKAGLTVANNEAVKTLAATYDLDLLQLAALTEFDGDQAALDELVETALDDPYQFEHEVSRQRQRRERERVRNERIAALEEQGIGTLDPVLLNNGEVVRLAYLERDESIEVDPELGDGVLVVVQSTSGGGLIETEVVLEPAKYGYKQKAGTGSSDTGGKMTPEQLAERKRVIACNKAWDAAAPVRADWLLAFVSRKSIPKDAAPFIAVMLTRHAYAINGNSTAIAHELLGIEQKHGYGVDAIADHVEQYPAKAGVAMLAVVLSKLEAGTSRNTWRHAETHSRAYLAQLRTWGYALAPVEQIALGELTDLPDNGSPIDLDDVDAYDDEATASE